MAIIMYCDSECTIYIASNHIFNRESNTEIEIYFHLCHILVYPSSIAGAPFILEVIISLLENQTLK